MDLQRAKEILGAEAEHYSDNELLSLLDLFQVFEKIIYEEYRKSQIKKSKKNVKKHN